MSDSFQRRVRGINTVLSLDAIVALCLHFARCRRCAKWHRDTMIVFLRHVLAIALLPFTVAVLVPIWIAQRNGVSVTIGSSIGLILMQLIGVILLALGLVLFVASLWRFTTQGNSRQRQSFTFPSAAMV